MKMMTPAVKIFFILTLTLHFSAAPEPPPEKVPLNMADNSIDDDCKDCNDPENVEKVLELLKLEMSSNPDLEAAWEKFADIKDPRIRALKLYTDMDTKIYEELNTAMRSGRNDYPSFRFKALYCLMTCGLQNMPNECRTVYRRSNLLFEPVGEFVRGGSFLSTSLRSDLKEFGEITCFKIQTCYGADISKLSVHPKQEEVLVPSYEKFKVTGIEENMYGCKKLIHLKSAGIVSNMSGAILKTLAKHVKKG